MSRGAVWPNFILAEPSVSTSSGTVYYTITHKAAAKNPDVKYAASTEFSGIGSLHCARTVGERKVSPLQTQSESKSVLHWTSYFRVRPGGPSADQPPPSL